MHQGMTPKVLRTCALACLQGHPSRWRGSPVRAHPAHCATNSGKHSPLRLDMHASPSSRLALSAGACTSSRPRHDRSMRRHLRHVHSPDAMDSMAHKSKRKGSTARLAWARMAGTGPSLHFLRSNFAPNTLRARESVGSAQGGAVRGRCRQPLREEESRRGRLAGGREAGGVQAW